MRAVLADAAVSPLLRALASWAWRLFGASKTEGAFSNWD